MIDSNGLHLLHAIPIPGSYRLGLGNAAYASDLLKVSPDGSWIFVRMVNTNGENHEICSDSIEKTTNTNLFKLLMVVML